ncbi:cis-prenyltransferase [Tilletia horrida]|uniref:Alkyl transferase n=1 Tax=Tilletia horrida TaxID=155126 RepID=A0AAN6GVX5_9BASI|nr:cis-prenyltransferase [Tilletia horrida]KAK0568864.1 cis-prenyltransferase [Tilletia horrida]
MSFLVPTLASFVLPILALGPVPRHIAFIMDGNRRWATSHKTSIKSGHVSGFEALKRVLESCLALEGLECISVYAFAIDNFKRTQEEVDALMELASDRLIELASHGQIIAKHCVRIRIIGRTELLPAHVQEAVRKVEDLTRENNKALLNICIPYAARDEMAAAVRSTLTARMDQLLNDESESASQHQDAHEPLMNGHSQHHQQNGTAPHSSSHSQSSIYDPITAEELDRHMMFAHTPPLDLLVRTSGVRRLSDFMLWQCNTNTQLCFVDCYWPQFGLRHLIPILLNYQRAVWARAHQQMGRPGASRRIHVPPTSSEQSQSVPTEAADHSGGLRQRIGSISLDSGSLSDPVTQRKRLRSHQWPVFG